MGRLIIFFLLIFGCQLDKEHQRIVQQNLPNSRRDSLFEPLDKGILSSFLPDSIVEFSLRKMESESTGGFGYKVSTVIGTYTNQRNDKKIKLYISDASGAKSILGTGSWANLNFDKSNEYTSELEGYKYYIKMNTKRKKGEINLLIKNRFILQLKGTNVDSSEMNRLLNKTLLKNHEHFEK